MTYRPNRGGQGGWRRGRGRVGSYQGGPRPTTAQLPPDRDIMEGIDSRVIETISIPSASVQAQEFSGALMENVEYIASYNWTDSQEPTIIVPGSPPIWNDRRVPFALSPDTGVQTVDQNGYRMRGLSSFLPLFAAADMTSATIDWPSIDIITDRNALRKLMRWINGTSARGTRDFRVDLELLGENTVVFNRWEKRFKEEPKYETFGFSFEEETTNAAPGCGASTGHHRIVKYDYFGLKMVVRFEVDACLPTPARISSSSRMPAISRKDDSDLSAALDKLSVQASSSKGAETTASHTYGLKIVSAGAKISQQSIIELTTRSQRRIQEFDWEEALPQLYLSSTPHLYIGVHQRGNFLEIRKFGLDEDKLVKERRAAAESYEKLGRVLEIIQGLVVEHGVDGALSLVCTSGRLEVYKRETGARLLPADVRARFD